MNVKRIRHKHQITVSVSNDGIAGSLNLKQLDEVLNEARVEGAPEDALTFVDNIHPGSMGHSTSSITIEWTVEREPYGEGLKK